MAAELEKQSEPKAKHTNNYPKEAGLILAALTEFSQKLLWQSLVPHTPLQTLLQQQARQNTTDCSQNWAIFPSRVATPELLGKLGILVLISLEPRLQ